MKINNKFTKILLSGIIFFATIVHFSAAYAEPSYTIGISPMKQSVVLNAGDSYQGYFLVTNPAGSPTHFDYVLEIQPFDMTDAANIVFNNESDSGKIANWITLDSYTGRVEVNETKRVNFVINVPEDAPAGGQYAAIIVKSNFAENETNENTTETGASINQGIGIAHLIYTEIAGKTIHDGEILSMDLPSFLLSGNITGTASVKNNGNVHDMAKFKLQIFPLFSGEEIYTNEEDPQEYTVMPNRTRYVETTWDKTPVAGIFNAIYTVEFEGVTKQISKTIIICPIWLLFIIIFAIIALIMYFFVRSKNRKNNKKRTQSAKAE